MTIEENGKNDQTRLAIPTVLMKILAISKHARTTLTVNRTEQNLIVCRLLC